MCFLFFRGNSALSSICAHPTKLGSTILCNSILTTPLSLQIHPSVEDFHGRGLLYTLFSIFKNRPFVEALISEDFRIQDRVGLELERI